ncbi:MAG TPA: hypothetical protein V6C85_15180 [Allocoleopsis sp.]
MTLDSRSHTENDVFPSPQLSPIDILTSCTFLNHRRVGIADRR